MRITLIIYTMRPGGAERVVSIVANEWAKRGWAVTVLTFWGPENRPFYPLDPRITFRPLGIDWPSRTPLHRTVYPLRRLRALRKAIKQAQPDVVVSFMTASNVNAVLATTGLSIPVVVCEHIYPSQLITPAWEAARQVVYPFADRVAVLNQVSLEYFGPHIRRKGVVLPNPVILPPDDEITLEPAPPGDGRKVAVALGRLYDQKGFDMLLHAWARVAAAHPDWRLDIWGEGPERGSLEALRDRLELTGSVRLPGLTRNPYGVLKQAQLFVMSSRFEGFPMALCEALASGLPAVSFDCLSGPRDLIREGVDGLLVPPEDVPALATALDRLMGDEALRQTLAGRGLELRKRFGLEAVMAVWDEILASVGAPIHGPEGAGVGAG